MYYRGDIRFKGVSSNTYGLIVTEPPRVTHSEVRGDTYQIPYRNGDLHSSETYRGDAQISVKMAFVKSSITNYVSTIRQIRKWLTGTGSLVIADSEDAFYEVKKVNITTEDRIIATYGVLEVTFTVHPYEFLTSGNTAINTSSITNPNSPSEPLYMITGTANAEGTLTVNGNAMSFKIPTGGVLYIDTRRLIAYGNNNINASENVSGDYRKLRLNSGSNTASVTTGTLYTYPKWGYEI